MPWAPAQSREPDPERTGDECPLIGTDHGTHWFPVENGRQHCIGWHAMTRDLTHTRARFHARYLRGRNSNIVHRSRHEGWITWFPRPFHGPGQAEVVFWDVGVACKGLALRNPELLDADGVRAAEPYPKVKYADGVRLCPDCFPGGVGPAGTGPNG
jgi:hypothetical protein